MSHPITATTATTTSSGKPPSSSMLPSPTAAIRSSFSAMPLPNDLFVVTEKDSVSDDAPESPFSSSTTRTTTTTTPSNNKKRKRVQFEIDPSDTQQVKRFYWDHQLCKDDIQQLWMTPSDYEATLRVAMTDIVQAKQQQQQQQQQQEQTKQYNTNDNNDTTNVDNENESSVSSSSSSSSSDCQESSSSTNTIQSPTTMSCVEAMAQTYQHCVCPANAAAESMSVETAALQSLLESQFRGLESLTLPKMMRDDRKTRKQTAVNEVLDAQLELQLQFSETSGNDVSESLRRVSEFFSEPSRKFARALGALDGTFVQQQQQEQASQVTQR